uniref:Uncharacterized protein n=1 Tax=Heterorhabditis bacteriophora TaxID=37862 RepID=A0A1I7WA42_HETBA
MIGLYFFIIMYWQLKKTIFYCFLKAADLKKFHLTKYKLELVIMSEIIVLTEIMKRLLILGEMHRFEVVPKHFNSGYYSCIIAFIYYNFRFKKTTQQLESVESTSKLNEDLVENCESSIDTTSMSTSPCSSQRTLSTNTSSSLYVVSLFNLCSKVWITCRYIICLSFNISTAFYSKIDSVWFWQSANFIKPSLGQRNKNSICIDSSPDFFVHSSQNKINNGSDCLRVHLFLIYKSQIINT